MKLLISLLFCLNLIAGEEGGGIISSGGEYITFEKNPWFVGERPIIYCIKDNGGVSMYPEYYETDIEDAFYSWTNTISLLRPNKTPFKFKDGEKKNITTDFLKTDCEDPTVELTFLIGDPPKKVKDVLKYSSQYTLAFAGLESYDEKTGRAKGFIWLSPDQGENKYLGPAIEDFWSETSAFHNVVLHELGHVFGLQHMENTLMDADYPTAIISEYTWGHEQLDEIKALNWDETETRFCSNLNETKSDLIKELIGTEFYYIFEMCFNSDENGNLELEINSTDRAISQRYKINLHDPESIYFKDKLIGGRFVEESFENKYEYSEHQFINRSFDKRVGTINIGQQRTPIIISKLDYLFEITLYLNNNFIDFPIYIISESIIDIGCSVYMDSVVSDAVDDIILEPAPTEPILDHKLKEIGDDILELLNEDSICKGFTTSSSSVIDRIKEKIDQN